MKGLIGRYAQGMAPKKAQPQNQIIVVDVSAAGASTSAAPFTGVAHMFCWGAGGSGVADTTGGGTGRGGGGGAACYMRTWVQRGQVTSYTVGAAGATVFNNSPPSSTAGNAGTASTITTPTRRMSAGGGFGGDVGSGGGGGIATGGDINISGGSTTNGNGAASADLTDTIGFAGGSGSASPAPIVPEMGGGGGRTIQPQGVGGASGQGGKGRVLIIYTRALL